MFNDASSQLVGYSREELMAMSWSREECYCAFVTAITERKRTQESLRASEARFKSMFDEAPLGIAVVDSLNGRFYSVNQTFAKIAGRPVDEVEQTD